MADTTLQQVFQNTANAIRAKTGKTASIYPSSFSSEISDISENRFRLIGYHDGGYGTESVITKDSSGTIKVVMTPGTYYSKGFFIPSSLRINTNGAISTLPNELFFAEYSSLLANGRNANIELSIALIGNDIIYGSGNSVYQTSYEENKLIVRSMNMASSNTYLAKEFIITSDLSSGHCVTTIEIKTNSDEIINSEFNASKSASAFGIEFKKNVSARDASELLERLIDKWNTWN